MLKQIRHITLGIMLAFLALPTGNAFASLGQSQHVVQSKWQGQIDRSTNKADMQYAQRKHISASQAKSAAMKQIRGAKFVNVQLVNQSTYRVRLQQKNGRIVDVYVDAYTGRVKG